ncbi:MAG TPA: hypothetical protein VN680_08135 [Burkholderiaceae bacterium]|jgi:hypothetical protein|nr:hypothetical protein [Burkholderiaceae bacterium]
MTRAILVALGTGAIITGAAAIGIGAALTPPPSAMSPAEYRNAVLHAEWLRGIAESRCDDLDDAGAAICRVRAAADRIVRVAQIEADYRHNEQAARAAQRARIDARYLVDRARCDTLGGFRRDRCLIEAHAAKGRALLEVNAPYAVPRTPKDET